MDLPPKARGPNSALPLNHPTTPPFTRHSVIFSNKTESSNSENEIFFSAREALISLLLNLLPVYAVFIAGCLGYFSI